MGRFRLRLAPKNGRIYDSFAIFGLKEFNRVNILPSTTQIGALWFAVTTKRRGKRFGNGIRNIGQSRWNRHGCLTYFCCGAELGQVGGAFSALATHQLQGYIALLVVLARSLIGLSPI